MFLIKNCKCRNLARFPRVIAKCHYPRATLSSSSSSSSASSSSSSSCSSSSSPSSWSTNVAPAEQRKDTFHYLTPQTYGQPTASTHPHLIKKDELVPGVSVGEFQQRRIRLLTLIQKYARDNPPTDDSVNANQLVIVPSSTKKFMSDRIPYVFRQNSDFFYLTGCLEPDSILVLFIDERNNCKSTLFLRPKDKHAELWDGPRTGTENAIEMFGVDEAYPISQFERLLNRCVEHQKPAVWFDALHSDQQKVTEDIRHVAGNALLLNSPAYFIQNMRLIKSPAEQALMRRTCQIASDSINEVMRESRPGHSEHHLFAMIDYKCRMRNANYLAYPPVVASGNNATTIHYINNSQLTRSGDLVLLDAGCEYGGYTSDITRTWPITGSFTEPQKIIYDVVLQLQKDLIDELLEEGGETLDNLFETMCAKLGRYLQVVGLVPKDITDHKGYVKAGYKFCPHHVSHYLGMDVHDTPLMPRTLRIVPGMVFTVEPGIYISQDRTDVPKEFRGIGVRIEDDILIDSDNCVEVLTSTCIKERITLDYYVGVNSSKK